jgi:hypothetical protein
MEIPGELPVKMKFLLPNGKELKNFRKTLNVQGSVDGEVELAISSITGSYTLEVYTSNDVLLGSKNFNIEEFVPDRIKVTTKLDKPAWNGTNHQHDHQRGELFWSACRQPQLRSRDPGEGLNFSPKKYNQFDFAIENQGMSFDKVVREGSTDENGNAKEVYEVPALYANKGLLESYLLCNGI